MMLFRHMVARLRRGGSDTDGDLAEARDSGREPLSVLADRATIRSERHERLGLRISILGVVAAVVVPFLIFGLSTVNERRMLTADEEAAPVSSEVASAVDEGEAADGAARASSSTSGSSEPHGDGTSTGGAVLAGCYEAETSVPCSSVHSREVYRPHDGQGCSDESLILYLGGLPGTDVLGPELSVAEAGDGEGLCVITGATSLPAVSLEGLWRSDLDHDGYADGGGFRQCFTYQDLPVSCDEEHAAETVYEGSPAGDADVECGEKYEEFVGRAADNDIRVRKYSSGQGVTCRVEVRGEGDVLAASVRGLGDTALPLR